ncbi:G-protein coupled receptor 4-like [Symphorus nematophorus]
MDIYYIIRVLTWIIISIGLPLTLVAIYAVFTQVQKDDVGPIYIINLLLTDLIQLCCMIVLMTIQINDWESYQKAEIAYNYSLGVSVGFMVCVALERYLVIVHPLWYRFKRTIKISVVVCVLVWVLPLVFFLTFYYRVDYKVLEAVYSAFLLLPLPLFIFFLVRTVRALSASVSVPSDEKRRIVGILVLVLLIYSLLFLPRIIFFLSHTNIAHNSTFDDLSLMFIMLSPLADVALYVFLRKGTIDKLLASVCCCKMDSDDVNSAAV